MNNASIGNTTQPELLNQTDWARVQAMTDDDIVFDEDNPRTQPEDWDNAIVLLQTESEFPVSGYSGNPTVRVGN